jgi:hypothetical protein
VPASAARIKRLQGVLGEFACHTVRISHDPADSSPRASRAAHALLLQSQPLTFAPCRPARQAEHNQQPWRRRWSASTYDDANGLLTARAWWLLGYFGHARVAALDGGLGAWVAAGRRLVEGEEALIDARDSERDRGEFERPMDPVAGHCPADRAGGGISPRVLQGTTWLDARPGGHRPGAGRTPALSASTHGRSPRAGER